MMMMIMIIERGSGSIGLDVSLFERMNECCSTPSHEKEEEEEEEITELYNGLRGVKGWKEGWKKKCQH